MAARRSSARESSARRDGSASAGDGSAFDAAYYERFYRDPATRVADEAAIAKLATFVCSYVDYLAVPVGRVLDMGCGLGHWRATVKRCFPNASYLGVEVSGYLCREFGWTQGSIVTFCDPEPEAGGFDLTICQGVLQYLNDADAEAAIENLAGLTHAAMYLEALTQRDWDTVCDQSRTDGNCYLRSGAWYRKRLEPHFRILGGGVFIKRDWPVMLYDFERPAGDTD